MASLGHLFILSDTSGQKNAFQFIKYIFSGAEHPQLNHIEEYKKSKNIPSKVCKFKDDLKRGGILEATLCWLSTLKCFTK